MNMISACGRYDAGGVPRDAAPERSSGGGLLPRCRGRHGGGGGGGAGGAAPVRATAGAAARPTPHGDLRGGGGGDGGRVQSARGGAAGGRDPRGPVGRRTVASEQDEDGEERFALHGGQTQGRGSRVKQWH
jgi:hypothetical protein